MNKELEALHTIAFNTQINGLNFGDELRTIEQALQRLESIDNAKPSEALECLEIIGNCWLFGETDVKKAYSKQYDTIEQYILKAQEQENENAEYKKVLKIVFEKSVDVFRLKKLDFNTFNQLQKSCGLPQLTREEFELLKRYCNENNL